ncbi:hypothetical protein KSD_71430 [Ktedonobacter sp. SOSP1-85]|uniref:DUF2278 family protein n=1 Tax=Ktedonobacter sp. SOSP1-85 TaxID=2778367 RepID=UPI0019167082|nr:DUF2278 family protein [Ktedonobacter sp. SOSP1-85]GHO79372.1 hypothetical protein KSD_71430 [Ktedonobacter sp. SOSP1-85]
MPVVNYGVLKGYPRKRLRGTVGSPHYQILVVDDNEIEYRIAVNVKSQVEPSELLYLHIPDLHHPFTDQLTQQHLSGFTALDSAPGGLALDFQRGDLVNQTHIPPGQIKQMFIIESEDALNTILDEQLLPAINQQDQSVVLYAFGSGWYEPGKPDQVFGFEPGNGIHNIHVNDLRLLAGGLLLPLDSTATLHTFAGVQLWLLCPRHQG